MFIRFNEIKNLNEYSSLIGKKGESLVQMAMWDLPVPDGGCVTTNALDCFISENELEGLVTDVRKLIREKADEEIILGRAKEAREVIIQCEIPEELKESLTKLQADNPDSHFAVRSSGTKEDMADASFAGQYTTILNVKSPDHLFTAVKQCWSSLFNTRVINYCINKEINFSDMNLGVVVQKMVPAEKSGVIFTVNPLKGYDSEILIEACFGIGEALVGGEVTPDQYFYNWIEDKETERVIGEKRIAIIAIDKPPFVKTIENTPEKQKEAVLSKEEVRELAELAVDIQAKYGFPVDIEWVKLDGKFQIVQSRPITTISFSGIEGEWTTADFKDGGVSSTVCSQYMWSLYDYIFEKSMSLYMQEIKLLDSDPGIVWADMFYGRGYWNAGAVKDCFKKIPGFNERDFDEDLGVEVAYEGDGHVTKLTPKSLLKGIQVLGTLDKKFKAEMDMCEDFRKQQLGRLDELNRSKIEELPRKEFFEFFEKFIKEDYYTSEGTYFSLIYSNTNLNSLFKDNFNKINKKGELSLLNLMSGLTDLSHLKPIYNMWDIRNKILADDKAAKFWKETPVSTLVDLWRQGSTDNLMDDVRTYIEEVKFHSTRELDITVPRYGEDPSPVMETVKSNLELDDKLDPRKLNQKQYDAYVAEKKKYMKAAPFYGKGKAEKMLTLLRNYLWWREELRDMSTKYYYEIRRITLVLGKHFVDMKIMEDFNDIFFFPVNDMYDIINERMSVEEAKTILGKNIKHYNSFRNYQNPNEIGSRYMQKKSAIQYGASVLRGIPCSTGTVTGKAKVIRDIFDADRLEKGDILITKFTDPGWTPKFSLITAVATETGGLLSHAAVISREYGIPAVLAVKDLTSIVKDGQQITIDGDNGQIILE